MDQEWIKHLAQAENVRGEWVPADPEAIRAKVTHAVLDALANLMAAVEQASHVFNMHNHRGVEMRVLPSRGPQGGLAGFVMLFGKVQIRVEQQGSALKAVLAWMRDFSKEERTLNLFSPQADPFGGVTWVMNQKAAVTQPLIVQQLFRDLCEAADRMRKGEA